MYTFRKFMYPTPPAHIGASVLILAARIFFGLLLINHGITKWLAFENIAISFPDPLGVGSLISLILTIFAEVFCSMGFILGLLYRLCLIPMIFTMCIAAFVIHGNDPLTTKEPALMFLFIFIILFIAGPGYISVDSHLFQKKTTRL